MTFLGIFYLSTLGLVNFSFANEDCSTNPDRPNIILILTDDQGYGDVGFNGNKTIKTPNLDRLANEGVNFTRFYVTPVCSPTRAGIMTGRWHYRTGVTNVGSCGDRIKRREMTIAEALRRAGYATAIFGKWHLGDNYPMRPQDKGFEEAVIHEGCCLTPWFRPNGENYFDPFLFHNGKMKQYRGYCMDVYTDLTIEFAQKNANKNKPFFIYLSSNTPHSPLNVSREYSEPYREMGLGSKMADYYGTITNIDYNIGRLMNKLKELKLDEKTIVIFLTDNGAGGGSSQYWPLKLRGRKATVYEGGIRVPCLFRWPSVFKSNTRVDQIAGYVDLMPTILDVARVTPPEGDKLDGVSLMPLLTGRPGEYPDRTFIIQWHQGLNPQLYRSFTVFNQRFKLVQAVGGFQQSGKFLTDEYNYELFDIPNDPLEQNDLSTKYPNIVSKMKQQYEEWFWDVMKSRGPDPEMAVIGSDQEDPIRLMASGSFVEQDQVPALIMGEWPCYVSRTGNYDISIVFYEGLKTGGKLHFKFNEINLNADLEKEVEQHNFKNIRLKQGSDWLEAYVESNSKRIIPTYIDIAWKGNQE